MTVTGFSMFIRAIHQHCMTICQRAGCHGCVFERHSERKRQIHLFLERRQRIAAARRAAAGVAK